MRYSIFLALFLLAAQPPHTHGNRGCSFLENPVCPFCPFPTECFFDGCNNGQCIRLRRANQSCDEFDNIFCAPGLTCTDFRCRGSLQAEGARCASTGDELRCNVGLVCAGREDNPVCVRPLRAGAACVDGDPLGVCRPGSACRNGRCRSVRIPLGGRCSGSGARCARGLFCSADRGICMRFAQLGAPCGEEFVVCNEDAGFICAAGFPISTGLVCIDPFDAI